MGGDGWEDPNKPKQIKITFDLPEGSGKVHVQTFVDGKETGYGDPNLSKQTTWTTKPSGRGDAKVEIYIDSELYRSYDVNFDNGTQVETTDMQALAEYLERKGSQLDSNDDDDDDDDDLPEPSDSDSGGRKVIKKSTSRNN